MVTVDDLSPGRPLPSPIVVTVTAIDWTAGKSRRAEVELTDIAHNPLRLIDYEGANLSVDWTPGFQYRISRCQVNRGGRGYGLELAPSKRTRVEPLGPADRTTRILALGDTHIGRTEHPRTGESINPLEAFVTAIEYGIDQGVDAVVHTGDIFHESATETHAHLFDQLVFGPLDSAGIPFYYVQGNHLSEKFDNMLLEKDDYQISRLDTTGVAVGPAVRLFGINHHEYGHLPWDELTFPSMVTESVSILVLHQTLRQISGRGSASVDLDRIQDRFGSQFSAVLSGHHHDAVRVEWQGIPVMYTGAAERMSKKSRPVDRVAWLLLVRDGSISIEQYDIP